jgi:digeranylgeranylglycerophospholipid reductase
MIPKDGGRANVGLVTTEKKGAIKYLESFVEDTYLKDNPKVNPPWRGETGAGGKAGRIRPFGGTIPISGPRSRTFADGMMMIGDAAGFTSPLFEGGSHLALKSGKFAAEVAAQAIAAGDVTAKQLGKYEKMWKAEFPPYDKILRGKTALYNLSDDELSIMGRCLPEEMGNMGPFTKLAVGLRILFRKPTLFTKRVISVLLSFGYSRAKFYGW